MFLTRAKKIQNLLFGRVGHFNGELHVISNIKYPDGRRLEWPGNNGLIFELLKRIEALENSAKSEEVCGRVKKKGVKHICS